MEDIQIITNADPEARNIEEKIDEYPPGGVPHEINESFPDVEIPDAVEPLPVIEEKKYITEEDVFTKHNEITQIIPVVKKVRKRRTMTEESLAKLALARVKAQETRKRNSELRKEDIMKIATETTTKALLSYEEKRLIKKAEKKKKYEEDHKKAIVRDTILKATGQKYGESGYFNSCFD